MLVDLGLQVRAHLTDRLAGRIGIGRELHELAGPPCERLASFFFHTEQSRRQRRRDLLCVLAGRVELVDVGKRVDQFIRDLFGLLFSLRDMLRGEH
jgi:hypothetical protein